MATSDTEAGDFGQNRTVRFSLVVLMMIFATEITADISGLIPGDALLMTIITIFVAIFFFATISVHFLIASYVQTRRRPTRSPSGGAVDLASIRKAYGSFVSQFDSDQISQYAKSVLKPRKLRGRVIEEISPLRRTLRQKVSTILEIPKGAGQHSLLFPLLMPVKGELQDDLSISVDGAPAATLTHREYLLLTTAVLEALLVPTVNSLTAREAVRLAGITDTALRLVARRGRLVGADLKTVRKCAKRIEKLAPKAGSSFLAAAVLLRKLANHYAIVVIIPTSRKTTNKRLVAYERFLIPKLHLAPGRKPLRFLHDRLGMLLGARPVQLSLGVDNAASARSYHLFVMGPEGMYVGWQNMNDPDGIFKSVAVDENLSQPYGRFQRRLGQRYLHLYTRSIPEGMADKLHLDVRFYEVPPGSMGAATLAAGASFALIYLVALILPGTHSLPAASQLGSDFPALVLAFPALAGALVGFETRTTALVGGTLSSKASALLTIVLSLGASGLFMAEQTGAFAGMVNYQIPYIPDILGVSGLLWQLLVTFALINAFYALYTWFCRTATFCFLANRPGDHAVTGPSES